ncbi:MAG: beta-N-acetylhexosaminidase, partial [Muribaculaceae bacterium]
FMLDVGRHFYPVEYIKEVIDMLALHNINYFHWHLTEDQGWRIEIKKYPQLTQVGAVRPRTLINQQTMTYDETPHSGFYTQQQAREVVEYAAQRYITVVPEVDLPGHMMAALVAYPQLGCTGGPYEIPCRWGVFPDVLCAGNDATLQFAKDVLNEIMDIFPSPYIHIGGDECPKTRWKECPKCQAKIKELNLTDTPQHSKENQLQTYFMSQIGQLINSRGRKMVGWDEMLEGGLAPGATVMSWTSHKPAVTTAKLHHDVIVTPIQYLYFSNPHHNKRKGIKSLQRVYNFEPMPKDLTPEEQKYVIGTQGCLWTEWTRDTTKVEWQIMPRLAALCELQWAQPQTKNFAKFLQKLQPMLQIYNSLQYGYRKDLHDVYVQCFESQQYPDMCLVDITTFQGNIYYTLNGETPTIHSAPYYGNIMVKKGTTVKAMAIRPDGTQTPVETVEVGKGDIWKE